MWARFTVLNETPIASAIAGCVIPLSRSNTIWMRSRCAAGIFHRSAVFSSRICFLVHLTIRPPESDSHSESYRSSGRETEKYRKPLDSISYGSGMRRVADDGSRWRGPGLCHGFCAEEKNGSAASELRCRCAWLHHGSGPWTHRIQGCGAIDTRPKAG